MSTATPRSRKDAGEAIEVKRGGRFQDWLLIVLVFVAGAASLAVELTASRLLAPYFGTSLFVWANLIGLILLYLTIGYYFGGRLADHFPRSIVLYGLTAAAALLIALIPLLSKPILAWSQSAFASFSISVFYGSLVSVILLFALPTILLGCVSPFAIRLSVHQVGRSGRTSGQLYAISTAGSIAGTFLPVLVLIPWIGTASTFIVFATALLLVSLIGLLASRTFDGPSRKRVNTLLTLLLLMPLLLSLLGLRGPIKAADGSGKGAVLVTEKESAYNYIQVVRIGDEMRLTLNEGVGIHSLYNPHQLLTQGPWDYFLVAPLFNKPPFSTSQLRNACIIGLGAGTIAHQLSTVYGPIPIDGVELDSEIVSLGRQYFGMNESNLNVIVQDGRYYLTTTTRKYDMIGIDAYQQPYVPFQLTTHEFFNTVRAHLTPTGVAVVNAGRTSKDFRLVNALAETMRASFANVYIIDALRYNNSVIIATNAPTSLDNFYVNTGYVQDRSLQSVTFSSLGYGNMRQVQRAVVHFTDDRAPVEQIIDQIIFDVVETNNR